MAEAAPHYREMNESDRARRVLVVSYAPASEGYTRAMYYDARATAMNAATERDGRFRISTLADFAGEEVAHARRATTHCTHETQRSRRVAAS